MEENEHRAYGDRGDLEADAEDSLPRLAGRSGNLVFAPFFRAHCGAYVSTLEDFAKAKVVSVYRGNQDGYLETPTAVERAGAPVVSLQETACTDANG